VICANLQRADAVEITGEGKDLVTSSEPLRGMVAKRFLIPDILAEHLERLVPAMLLHLEQIGALPPRLGEKARPQTMSGKQSRIVASRSGPRLDDQRHRLRTKAVRGQTTMRSEPSEKWPAADLRRLEPGAIMAAAALCHAVSTSSLAFLARFCRFDRPAVAAVPASGNTIYR